MKKSQDMISLKWYKDGIIIFVSQSTAYEELEQSIEEKFEKSKAFFTGSEMRVGFQGTAPSLEEQKKIIATLSGRLNCKLSLWENPEILEQSTEEKLRISAANGTEAVEKALALDIDEGVTKFYKKTIRSGQYLKSEGHMVILGDVNPGAEIEATGNIVVMGTVKGIVHAGAAGNRDAVVVALNLSPTQLRIADIITRAPDDDEKHELSPEVAYISGNRILIEDFLQKKK